MTDVSRLPGAIRHQWDWQLDAACRGVDSSLFFHPSDERGDARQEREEQSKRVCRSCPVRTACLLHSLRAREKFGVWGGLGEQERRALLASRQRRGRRWRSAARNRTAGRGRTAA
ncbi:WhiB family transcriptional regulator [Streptomyces formicae]|uniref:Transcriptional regulator WhiB n=1 Tax=Streptomyces formicae TaxID=1616117 RepID=A0ABY3WSF3_9ACTN|nr:WhiB family transcriptional regulator [Streptomyces formicae]UNM13446.1 WhiB family transcriptional regulator [Streptomyces formicae]